MYTRILNNITDRLEKIRRGASGVSDDYLECSPLNSELVSGGSDIQLQHDSAESSVEGKNEIFGRGVQQGAVHKSADPISALFGPLPPYADTMLTMGWTPPSLPNYQLTTIVR